MVDETHGLVTRDLALREVVERWQAFWNLEDIGRPLWLVPMSPGISPTRILNLPIRRFLQDRQTQLAGELELLAWRARAGLGDDFVPHLQPQQGTPVFASAFGCEVEFFDHTLPWAHPAIKADDPPEKVYELPAPAVTAGQLGDMLAFTDYFVDQTGGRYPIALTDLQGPLDTAYLVWDSCSFMTAMYTNPREVHHLMRLVTDLIIAFAKEQRARCPEFIPCHYPSLYLPDGRGIAISEDCLAVVGADVYREFALPYNSELAEEFGGLFIHSCGRFAHQFDNLAQIYQLRGLNFGVTEQGFGPLWERFGGKVAVVPHLGLNKDPHFESALEFVEHVFRQKTTNRGLCILASPTDPAATQDPAALGQFADRVRALVRQYA
ncbi:MAG: hypothetical protein HYY04_14360 [Chloroflexi bacterium]|nr:hypothetical protein [Chloroflexota bacterium]